ncbi:Putative zn(2)Cys(6) fungal-type DNA-binding domain-containing protein [Colletotrichum destructivum]|uniref:Zn(2)Cys(6) fungal-type DNA-binding domain-containing protein n=1 Tax=Colletotrichum destructivum TaxID=34406 RepID=A0AAX4IQY3_9PEZI|nr:Putative zn(2)Cys(6) fungal-type DNA-binding domain-containing protein [Colletotrichum destructivum]
MARLDKQKACLACTESKRRCDKRLPMCTRCDDRDVDCQYPVTKRRRPLHHDRPFLDTPTQQQQHQSNDATTMADALEFDAGSLAAGIWGSMPWLNLDFTSTTTLGLQPASSSSGLTGPSPAPARHPPPQESSESSRQTHNNNNKPQHSQPTAAETSLAESRWFLAPSSWRIEHWPVPAHDAYPAAVMTNFNRGLQAWVRRWATQGHNPFIHRALYAEGGHFPACVQDAFTTAAACHHKTPQNEAFVHRILDERAAALVAAGAANPPMPLETRDHLARVHALHVYTVLRLYDGDVSQRAAAESHLPVLDLWSRQLWDSAIADVTTLARGWMPAHSNFCPSNPTSSASFSPPAADAARTETAGLESTYESDLVAWNLWVLSESIRRTWIVVGCTIGVYKALKGQWGVCPGGSLFTARAGLWDAPSAPRWAALRRDLAAGAGDGLGDGDFFVQSGDGERIFRNAAAAEVDEFARHLFTCIWGLDRLEDWALRTASKGEVNLVY